MWGRKGGSAKGATFFGRLRRNVRGNTLAMMAVALVPLSAMAGSAIDMGRLYVVKVRLQQACDAGVLAGRKSMVSAGATLDTAAATQAQTFFGNNFRTGWMKTSAVSFVPTKTAENQVAGTATAKVPMSIMKMFAAPDVTLNVECEARYDVADTDIMFVLDTTGSMACAPEDSQADCSTYVSDPQRDNNNANDTVTYTRPTDGTGSGNLSIAGYPGSTGYYVPEKSNSRMKALRAAVLSFYDTLDETKDPTTNVRYGFVTYTSTVNAGKAIMDRSASYMIGGTGSANWNYQTRKRNGEYSSDRESTINNTNANACKEYRQDRTPATGYDGSTNGVGPRATEIKTNMSNSTCTIVTTTYVPKWSYDQYPLDVAAYVSGIAVTDPTKVTGAMSRWQGCIEERDTTADVTSFSTDSLPADLDPDLIPSSNATRWRPMWPDVIYDRYFDPDATNGDDNTYRPWVGGVSRMQAGYVSCGKPVQRLKTMQRADVSAYVNATDFRAIGGTYHDTGMIWGTRLLSPSGVFATDTAPWPGRQAPNRVLIFMTDGDMAPAAPLYGMYGIEKWDQRVTAGKYTDADDYKNYHNQRFLAECSKAKSLGMDVWVVGVGQSITDTLRACATSADQAVYAGTSGDVSDAFANIAKRVAALRISK